MTQLQAEASSLYKQWMETLAELKHITEPEVRSMWLSHLTDLHDRASSLLETDLSGSYRNLMHIVAYRDVDDWVTRLGKPKVIV